MHVTITFLPVSVAVRHGKIMVVPVDKPWEHAPF
jgi:hypothetical protein